LLVVDGGWNILCEAEHSLNGNFHRVTELVRPER
jgi:hypothetical protein